MQQVQVHASPIEVRNLILMAQPQELGKKEQVRGRVGHRRNHWEHHTTEEEACNFLVHSYSLLVAVLGLALVLVFVVS